MKTLKSKYSLNIILAFTLSIIIGIILIANPMDISTFICRIIGFALLVAGLFITGSYFLNIKDNVSGSSLIVGLVETAFGVLFLLKPEILIQFFYGNHRFYPAYTWFCDLTWLN